MNELKQKFMDLPPRDQLLLMVLSGVVVLYILIFVLLLPMQRSLKEAEVRNQRALVEQETVRELAGQVLAQRQSGSQPGGNTSLNALLNDSLREFGLVMENFQPSGSTARVRLSTSDFNKVLAWLHELEVRQGLTVRDLTVASDQNAPGAVQVNLQLAQGG